MAKLTRPFRGVPNGEIYPVEYKVGDECPPELEAGAFALGALAEGKKEPSENDVAAQRRELMAQLEAAGITFDKRWGTEKLVAALAEEKKD
jgi:hypothetical protein